MCPQTLPERVESHERLELAGQLAVPSQSEVGLDPLFEAGQPQLFEAGPLEHRERLLELGERRPAPEIERCAQRFRGIGRPCRGERLAAAREQLLEAGEVELAGLDVQDIPGRLRLEPPGRQHLAES